MRYLELSTEEEIASTINEIRSTYKNLSQIMPASDFETTMGGKKILSIYFKLEPVMKIEGDESLLNLFLSRLRSEIESTK